MFLQCVMHGYPEIKLAYGESDEYSFVLHKDTNLYGKQTLNCSAEPGESCTYVDTFLAAAAAELHLSAMIISATPTHGCTPLNMVTRSSCMTQDCKIIPLCTCCKGVMASICGYDHGLSTDLHLPW